MSTTSNYFDRLPDELVEKIFSYFSNSPLLQPHNHIRLPTNVFYFDYGLHRPYLKENHAHLLRLAQVCRRFYSIIKSTDFWERKCRIEHIIQPDEHFPNEFIDYEKLYVYNPFHRSFNFVDENRWLKDSDSFTRLELCPCGTSRLYDQFDRLIPCRVTSHMTASYYQMDIPLSGDQKHGASYISQLRPTIEFSIYISPRWDCAAQIAIDLAFSDGHRWHRTRHFPQWTNQTWHQLIYRYTNYKEMPSSVSVRIQAQDSQFWAGFYGMKFALTRLRLLLPSNECIDDEEHEVVVESKPEYEVLPRPEPSEIDDPTVETPLSDRFDARFDHLDDD